MSIELDGMSLVRHVRDTDTGATKLLSSVYNIRVSEKRSIVEHKIPGLEGGVLQDLGREPVRIYFEGTLWGEEAKETLERIRSKFKAGEAVPFNSDISGVAEVTQVLIEDLQVEEEGGTQNRYKYWMVLREYTIPEEEEEAPSQEEEAEEAVEEEADDALVSVNYIEGRVVDAEGNPVSDVDVKITFDGGEYTVKTDADGNYRKDDLETGKYTVTVDAPGYEDMKEEVEVRSSQEQS